MTIENETLSAAEELTVIDIEDKEKAEDKPTTGQTQRKLKARHLSMIAIGGTIGSGLFLNSGQALASAGPVGALLGFAFMGLVVFSVTTSLGEMCAFLPIPGSFTNYATRFVDPALGFATGWNYWYSYAITLPAEITAAAIVISYWNSPVNIAVWITIFYVACFALNMIGADAYGEAEFWMAIIKVVTVIGLIILGFVLICGGGPTHDVVGFRYWKDPGPFNSIMVDNGGGYFLATCAVFVQAAFSYLGTEIVAVTSGEAENPTKTLPRAIKRVFIRIILFYLLGVFVIGMLIPSDDPRLLGGSSDASASPFVIFIEIAQIQVLPSIINAVILTAALSAGNSDLYAASRTLYALAIEGKAPSFLKRCNKRGLPYFSVIVTGAFGLLAFLNVSQSGSKVFNWFILFTTVTGLAAWAVICLSYIRFHAALKYHKIDRNTLPYRSPLQPYSAWFGFVMCIIIIIFNGFTDFSPFDPISFVSSYGNIPIFFGLFFGYKFIKKTKIVPLSEVDFTMTKGYEIAGKDELTKDTLLERIMNILM
ncbi:amino acid transporter [Planoprotostelium fungivorum]|uniref:Amino acid transporter n=1 Tax=Planoprotostelium fungivorum TaxID=1890364 RepID=A0A2P6NSJ3_9EUKA|nr:amino acid transporter [Planoprotostelium fungivorum]